MKKIYYNKLVRDKIPDVIEKSGGKYLVKRLGLSDYRKELIKKVGEESDGVVQAKDRIGIIDELGDLLDVVDELRTTLKIKASEITASRKAAFIKKGGFKKKLFLVWSEDTGYKSNERKYKTNSKTKN